MDSRKNTFVRLVFFVSLPILSMMLACDPEGRKECHWVLEPEVRRKQQVEDGFIPLCARNRKTMKQDCLLQATKEQTNKYLGKKFRYVDLRVKSPALPRTIISVRFCDERKGV